MESAHFTPVIHMGDGFLSDSLKNLGVINNIPRCKNLTDQTTIGILSVWNQESWPYIISRLNGASGNIILIHDNDDIPEMNSIWTVVRVPVLLEPFFYYVDDIQKTGELPILSENFPNGVSTLFDTLNYLDERFPFTSNKFNLSGDTISRNNVIDQANLVIKSNSNKNMVPKILFSDLDSDNSGFIEKEEVFAFTRMFSKVDVDKIISNIDENDDGKIALNEFKNLISDDIFSFVLQSIPTLHSAKLSGTQVLDILQSHGFSENYIQIFKSSLESIISKPNNIFSNSIGDFMQRNLSKILGIKFLPGIGIIRTREIKIQGKTGKYISLFKGNSAEFVIRRSDDGLVFDARAKGKSEYMNSSWSKGRTSIKIGIDHDMRINHLSGSGNWKEQSSLYKLMVEEMPLSLDQMTAFELTGSIIENDEEGFSKMLCRCVNLDYMEFRKLLDFGYNELDSIVEKTGATTICGGCVKNVKSQFDNPDTIQFIKKGKFEIPIIEADSFDSKPTSQLSVEAEAFILQMNAEGVGTVGRLENVKKEILETGTWVPTLKELEWGARVSWRNATRCVGRYFWETLHIFDCRDMKEEEEVFQAIFEHLEWATNGGELRACMTVFEPANAEGIGPRLWNSQLIRYACHELEDGSIIGDPSSLELTKRIKSLGWSVPEQSAFDVLPLVVEFPGRPPSMKEIPSELILEVEIEHPELKGLSELNLRWYALPAVSNMSLEIGGLVYTLAPFNGFYMSTEIGARNFTDTDRYDLMEPIADSLGIERISNRELWKDRVQIELNRAILYSYERDNVRMMDHHTLSEWFLKFEKEEKEHDREVYAEWAWIVPPIGASATPLYLCDHWENKILKPNLFYLNDIHKEDSEMGHGTPAKNPSGRCPFNHGSID